VLHIYDIISRNARSLLVFNFRFLVLIIEKLDVLINGLLIIIFAIICALCIRTHLRFPRIEKIIVHIQDHHND